METKLIYPKNTDISSLKKSPELACYPDAVLKIMANRGYTAPEIRKFIEGNIGDGLESKLMKDADKFVDIVSKSINSGDKIVVYSDYDCDGICGGATMTGLLKALHANADCFQNDRLVDGYGMCKNGVDKLVAKYPDVKLIITVDNGIVAYEGISYAKSMGIKVIVTDHHEPGKTLPVADAVIDVKRKDDDYPFKELCGAGLVFKLMLYLYYKMCVPTTPVLKTLDIVALATVGDVVPLIGENRVIVREGLKLIGEGKRKVFRIFKELVKPHEMNAHFTLAFKYVPMINAISRMNGNVEEVVHMFLTNDEKTIRNAVQKLIETNEARKLETEREEYVALKLLQGKEMKSVIVLYDDSFQEGIVGLIAGRLKERFNRPAIVFAKNDVVLKGSGRSIDGFHIKNALDSAGLTIGHGGHAKAAGLTILPENLEKFEEAINKIADSQLKPDDFVKKIEVDYCFSEQTANLELVDALKMLEPFGEGFRVPTILLEGFLPTSVKLIGQDKKHVKFIGESFDVLYWSGADNLPNIPTGKLNITGRPSINAYRGNVSLQFEADGKYIA